MLIQRYEYNCNHANEVLSPNQTTSAIPDTLVDVMKDNVILVDNKIVYSSTTIFLDKPTYRTELTSYQTKG